MKSKILVVGFIAAVAVSVISCNPSSKYKAELTQIDSCLTVLDTIEMNFQGIEFDSLKTMVNHVLMNEDTIRAYYFPDTLSLEIGKRMNECKGIRKTLKNLDAKEQNYADEIAELRTQFTNLKTDIENGVLAEDRMHQYIEEEKEALNLLNVSISEFYTLQEMQKRYYYSAVPVIDSLILTLKREVPQG